MVLFSDCSAYIKSMSVSIENQMGYVFSTWDNRDKQGADFESSTSCPTPAASCDAGSTTFNNIKFLQWGFNEAPPAPTPAPEPTPAPYPPATNLPFIGYTDYYGTTW